MPAERRCGVGVGSSYMIRLKEYVFGGLRGSGLKLTIRGIPGSRLHISFNAPPGDGGCSSFFASFFVSCAYTTWVVVDEFRGRRIRVQP